MAESSLLARLLDDLAESQRLLLEQAVAENRAAAEGLEAVLRAARAAAHGLADTVLSRQPAAGEWSMAEVLEHMSEHDRHYVELERLGPAHYVEHGLEHALQLWSLRRGASASPGGESSSASSATLK